MFDDLYFADRTNDSRVQDDDYIYLKGRYKDIKKAKSHFASCPTNKFPTVWSLSKFQILANIRYGRRINTGGRLRPGDNKNFIQSNSHYKNSSKNNLFISL